MFRIFQSENLALNKHQTSLKIMVATMMLTSFTFSLLFTFPILSEIYALPSRGGGGNGLASPGSHSTLHPNGAFPLSGVHTTGPGSLSGLKGGSNVINGPNGAHPNAPTVLNGPNVINGPNGPRVVNPNNPTTNTAIVNGPNGPRVVNPNNPTTNTAVVHPSNCPTVVHPNRADTTAVVHPSNCPSPNTKVTVNSGSSTSSSSPSLTVNNVQQGSSSGSTTGQSSQSTLPCLAKNTVITVNVYGGMTRNLPFKAGQTSNTVQGISVTLRC
jgi:hypothetical protein